MLLIDFVGAPIQSRGLKPVGPQRGIIATFFELSKCIFVSGVLELKKVDIQWGLKTINFDFGCSQLVILFG